MNRRILICVTFFALFLFSSNSVAVPISDTFGTSAFGKAGEGVEANYVPSPSMPPPLPEGPIYSDGEFQYAGLGAPLTTKEYAEGSNRSLQISNFNYLDNRYGEVRLPRQWTGYRLEADVYNLYDQPYFVQGIRENGTFESIAEWDTQNNGMGDNTSNPYYGTRWGSAYGYSGNGVQTWVEWNTGWTWNVNSYVVWRNNITIQRDDPVYAKLTFRVRVNLIAGASEARGRMVIYAEIAGIVYRLLLDEHCPNNGQWYQLSISVPADDLLTWSVPDIIQVRLGLGFTGLQTSWDYEYWGLNFDDVTLEVRGLVNPNDTTWLDLVMNSTIAQTAGYGYGSYSLVGTWPNPTTEHKRVVAHWQATDTDARLVQFTYNLTLYITRDYTTEQQTGPDGSAFTAKNGPTAYWTTWMYAYQPYFFSQYNLSMTRPTTETWTISNVTDPLFTDRTSAVSANSTHFLLSSSAINDIYGWWNFTFSSVNRITSISGLASNYYIGDILSIDVNHDTVTSGQCNITIYDSNHQVVHEESKSLTGSTVVSFSKLFDSGDTFAAGLYTICATYDNGATGSMTSAGFVSSTFKIIHTTDMTIEGGALTKIVDYSTLTTFFIRLTYDDLDKTVNPWVANTTGTVRINGTVDGNFIEFQQFGNLYQVEIDNDLMIPGNYPFVIQADDPYHDYTTDSITLQVRSDASLSSPQSPGFTIAYDESFTAAIWYEDAAHNGIENALITTNWPGSPVSTLNGSGWYNITYDTNDLGFPQTFVLNVQAERNYYTPRSIVLTIVVREIATSITYSTPGSVPYGEDITIPFNFTVNDPGHNQDEDGIGSVQKSDLTLTLDGSGLNPADFTFAQGPQPGMYSITILFASTKISSIKSYTLRLAVAAPSDEYADASTSIGFSVRRLRSSLTYDAPAAEPWGNDMVIVFYYTVDDPISGSDGNAITTLGLSTISCQLNGSVVSSFGWTQPISGQYVLTIYSSDITQVIKFRLYITADNSTDVYEGAARTLHFVIRAHQTQAIVDPPAETVLGQDTPLSVQWVDLDAGGDVLGNLTSIVVSNCPVGGDQTFGILAFTLDTDSWPVGTHVLTLTVNPDTSPGWYIGDSATVNVVIRIHYTGVTIQPPNPTPHGFNTQITVIWTDLDIGGNVPGGELFQVIVSDCPVGGDQTFTSLAFTLDTTSWTISSGYTLNVTVYATTGPRSYSDAWAVVSVVIRIHRVEVVIPTPSPTPWGFNTPMSVTWRDLDTGTTISGANLDNITVTDCPVGGDQTFTSLTFALITITWNTGQYALNVTIYPEMSPQEYEIISYQVTVTIRAHYVSVTVDPPAQTPWGSDTDLVVTWRDVDTNSLILEANLDNVTVTGGFGGDQTFSSLAFTLDTASWSVNPWSLTVWVYGTADFMPGSGPVTVTIRGHQTQTVVTPPQQTPFGSDTLITVSWLDLDQGSNPVPGGNLQQIVVTNCPVGGDQTFASLAFTLVTDTWNVGTYTLTVTTTSSSSSYLGSSSNTTVVIRIHYTGVTVQPPDPRPWGFNTPITVTWTDLDLGAAVPGGNLFQVIVSDCPVGGDQIFTSLSFILDTTSWDISTGYTLNVTLYAATGPRSYSDSWGSVSVVIRIHRVEVVIPTPPPTPWGFDITGMTVTWKDLDAGSTIAGTNLDNITVADCPVGGDQIFSTLTFTLIASTWSQGAYTLNVTVYPDMSPQLYGITSYQVTVTIRAHYVSVTVDPPAQTPWGSDTDLVVT
ncbi:MAG: hypothetical protein ACFE9O_02185, partial [Promethearchaeota archaeon]